MVKVEKKKKNQGTQRATSSLVTPFTDVSLRRKAVLTCEADERNVGIKRFLPGIQLVIQSVWELQTHDFPRLSFRDKIKITPNIALRTKGSTFSNTKSGAQRSQSLGGLQRETITPVETWVQLRKTVTDIRVYM